MADGTEYLIAMAAKLTGGDASVASLAELGDKMLKAGATAVDLEGVITGMSKAFEDSGASIKVASDAVTAGEESYKQAETAADRAAKAVERIGLMAEAQRGKLQAALDAGDAKGTDRATAKLRDLGARQGELATVADNAAAALRLEAAALDAVKLKAGAAVEKHAALTKGLANVKTAAAQAAKVEAAAAGTGKVNEMAEAFGKLGGPAGVAGQKVFGVASGFKKLGTAMGSAGPYVAIAVAIIAVATAAVVATVAIASWAVGLADAGRSHALLSAGIARSVQGGAELEGAITRLGSIVPQTSDELRSMAADLAKTGLRGKALTDELETAAVKAAELKWGPDFAKQMLSLEVQARKFDTNVSSIFGKLNIEKLLGGLSTLVALFDSSTASGKTMKYLFETMFQPLVDGAGDVVPMIERMFLTAEIWALKAYIAMKPYRSEIEAVGDVLLMGAAIIGGILAVALGIVIGLFGLLMVMVLDVANTVYELIGAFVAVEKAIYDGLSGAVTFMADLGANMIKGLVDGITGGATAVIKAMTGVVGGAVDAAKHALGIGSPSKVFAGLGDFTAQGFAAGVEGGSGDAQGAIEAMVAPPSAKVGGSARSGGGVTLTIQNINVNGENAKEQALDFIDQITAWLEGEGIAIGGGEVPA